MTKRWWYFLFLLWISLVLSTAVLLFSKGFLLTRVVHIRNSTCIPLKNCLNSKSLDSQNVCSKDENNMYDVSSASIICLPQKAKVVLLIIDALRYDFTLYNSSNPEPKAFQNKLPIMENLLKSQPHNTRLYQFVADPPTTTMQRLKALTTGSLPTFIDAGANFASAEINEDNIIDQAVKNNHSVIFMGDDTWNNLYPRRFKRSYPYPSFNVWDLDTVDNGVKSHLFSELGQEDWSLLIGHFLGVDHCGHRYGPMHHEMTRKLTEMNQVITEVISAIKDDTVLFVIGDHGMTNTGDHGGESKDEVNAAMFVYSKIPLAATHMKLSNDIVKQVDIVPTLSSILGIPIPFSNLGSVIINALPTNVLSSPDWKESLFFLWANVEQLNSYIKQYSESSDTFLSNDLHEFYDRYNILKAQLPTISNSNEFSEFLRQASDYMKYLREMCEKSWIQFDSLSMTRGLLIMFLVTSFLFMISDGIPFKKLTEFISQPLIKIGYGLLIITFASLIMCSFAGFLNFSIENIYFIVGILSTVILAGLVLLNWVTISTKWYYSSHFRSWVDVITRIILLCSICTVFSNSFVVEEGTVFLFLSISLLFLTIAQIYKLNMILEKSLLILVSVTCVLLRLSLIYTRCREEQQWCFSSKLSSGSGGTNWIVSILSLAVLVTFTKMWLKDAGNLVCNSLSSILARYSINPLVVCIGGFWILRSLPNNAKNKLIAPWQVDILAWLVYALVIVGILALLWNPLSIYIVPKTTYSSNSSNLVKHLLKQNENSEENIPRVYGLASVYSAAFSILNIYLTLLLALLLGDLYAPSIAILFFTAAFVMVISALIRSKKYETPEQIFNFPSLILLIWFVLSLYFFYGTGHQPTFPSIPWEAAFVGTGGEFTNNFIPALLVLLNTFGSNILFGFNLPFLVISPCTLLLMLPKLFNKKQNKNAYFAKGDMLLYEYGDQMMSTVFVVCCKYISFHAIRVFASMMAATIHCRHLMVWAIFAPKFIFESIGFFITLCSVLAGYLFLIRIHVQVQKFMNSFVKQNR